MTTCAVRGCDQTSTEIFMPTTPGLPPMGWHVCESHGLELKVNQFATGPDGHEIIIGESAPPSLITYNIRTTIGGSEIEMVLGHDGIEEQRIRFFMNPNDARDICNWVGHSNHTDVE